MLSIGLMSGTSMDGIDASLLETDGDYHIQEIGSCSIEYPSFFKILLKATESVVRKWKGDLNKAQLFLKDDIADFLEKELKLNSIDKIIAEFACYLHSKDTQSFSLADIFQHSTKLHNEVVSKLLQKCSVPANQVDLIGYHGQTLYHDPSKKISLQIGDANGLAQTSGITVISDFRKKDIEAGGQGAPFAPIYHQALAVRDRKLPMAVVNCGGISNITLIKNNNMLDLLGFDVGPGNCLIDRFIRQRTHGKESMDVNGQYGLKGKCEPQLLKKMYETVVVKEGKNYFSLTPPKSLDSGDVQLIPELHSLSLEDGCATLETFTAEIIANSLTLITHEPPLYWVLAGGGWKNPVIKNELIQRLTNRYGDKIKVETADQAGWNNQTLEAQVFAYLAVRSLQNKPLSVPGTTCVAKPLTGGRAYLPDKGPTKLVANLLRTNSLFGI